MKMTHVDVLEQMLAQVVPKTLRVHTGQANVIIHVECSDARPIQGEPALRGINERGEELILRGRTGENNARLTLARDKPVQMCGHGTGRSTTQRGAIRVNFKRETTHGGIMRSNDRHKGKI